MQDVLMNQGWSNITRAEIRIETFSPSGRQPRLVVEEIACFFHIIHNKA